MKYAIDRLPIGTEKEVSAEIFYGRYIPQKTKRFFCPDCGEPVFWRSQGGNQPNMFSHHKKIVGSPECDRRVDGQSGLNLYERVGLPVFLLHENDKFQLNIGFPAVGDVALAQANNLQTKVTIAGDHYEREIYVNQSNFLESATTLVPIDFIPQVGGNYRISLQSTGSYGGLKKLWSDYADGFKSGGAVFSYEEWGGKKIRHGDSVSPRKQYYVISKNFSPNMPEISTFIKGEIKLNNAIYHVYQMQIDVSINDEDRYVSLSNYMRSMFGVWLLETPPELIPLWPPAVMKADMLLINNSHKIFCDVSSGNDSPLVFAYSGCNVTPVDVEKLNNRFSVEVPVSYHNVVLSVDRKYVGREITIMNRLVKKSPFKHQILFTRTDGTTVPFDSLTKNDLRKDLLVLSNAKMELYVGSRDKIYQHIPLRNVETPVPKRRMLQELYFVSEKGVVLHFLALDAKRSAEEDEKAVVNAIRRNNNGTFIPAPRWVFYMMMKCHHAGYCLLANEIKRIVIQGKITVGAAKILEQYQNYICFTK